LLDLNRADGKLCLYTILAGGAGDAESIGRAFKRNKWNDWKIELQDCGYTVTRNSRKCLSKAYL